MACVNCVHEEDEHLEDDEGITYCTGDGTDEETKEPICSCDDFEEEEDEDEGD